MALEHRCASVAGPSTCTLIHIATGARAHTQTSAAPPRTTAAHASATDPAQSAAVRARPKAAHTKYNVVTEAVFHAPMFALKADAESNACAPSNATLGGGGKCSHASARMRARQRAHTHERAHARAHAWARTWRMSASATRAYDDRRTRQGVCIYCI
jgi:hypothetical protein